MYGSSIKFPEVKTKIVLTLNGDNKKGTLNIGTQEIKIDDYTDAAKIVTAINEGQKTYTSETNKPLISELTEIQTALNKYIKSMFKTGNETTSNTSKTIKAILDKLSYNRITPPTPPTTPSTPSKLKRMIDLLTTIETNTTDETLRDKTKNELAKETVESAITLAKDAVPKAESTTLFKAIKAYTESNKVAATATTLSAAFTTFADAAATAGTAAAAANIAVTTVTNAVNAVNVANATVFTIEAAVKTACQSFFNEADVIKYFEETNLDILTVPKEYIPPPPIVGGKSHKTRRSKAQKRRKTARRY